MPPVPPGQPGAHAPHRLPFVGRETQVGVLTSAVDAAALGEPVLVLVSGEPGIGKTRLVGEVAARVSSRTVWATCWEGESAPPYWPWRQVLRELAVEWPTEPVVHPGPDARFELFDAVVAGLAAVSAEDPLAIVLDDLHWADEATIRLLSFLSRDSRPRRLAVLGTYRDTDLDPRHPLALALGELVRGGLHVSLPGLGPRDVAAVVEAMGARDSDSVAQLHRRSGGNPYFLAELLQLGAADQKAPPPSVRAVVSRRLSRLADSGRAILGAMSVLDPEADPGTVARIVGTSPADVLSALTRAEAAGLAVRDGGRFDFAHALVREVTYAELDALQRAATHRRAADVLRERYGNERPAEVAHHLFEAALGEPDEACVAAAIEAAERDRKALAYEQAALWYDRALAALGPADDREVDLLCRSGEARLAAGDVVGARTAYERAATLVRQSGDVDGLVRAALGLGAGLGGFEIRLFDPLQIELLEDALAALGPEPSASRAWVLARLSVALSLLADNTRRRALSAEAIAVARASGDQRALGYALAAQCDATSGPDDCAARARLAAEIVELGGRTDDRELELLGLRLRMVAQLEIGDIRAADATLEQFAVLAERLRQPLYRWYVPLWRGMRALMRGDLLAATRYGAEAEYVGTEAGSANAVFLTFTQWWVRSRYEGRQAEAGAAMAELLDTHAAGSQHTAGPRAVIAALTGDVGRARTLLEEWLASGLPDRVRDSEWLPESAQLAQVSVWAGVPDAASRLCADLSPYADRFCVEGIGAACTGSVAAYLAMLAEFLGRSAEAEAYRRQAAGAHLRIGFAGDPPPLGQPPEPTPAAPPARPVEAAMNWEGATWAVTWAGRTVRVRDGKGLRDLAVLLSRPHTDVHCLELVGGSDVGGDAGPVLDQQARRAYEQRIRDLQGEIDEAHGAGDLGRAERAEGEFDTLVQQLSEAFGLSGRARGTGSAAERARSAVGWRIRAAIRNVGELHPELARHLRNAVRTGAWCSYRPETTTAWVIRDQRAETA